MSAFLSETVRERRRNSSTLGTGDSSGKWDVVLRDRNAAVALLVALIAFGARFAAGFFWWSDDW